MALYRQRNAGISRGTVSHRRAVLRRASHCPWAPLAQRRTRSAAQAPFARVGPPPPPTLQRDPPEPTRPRTHTHCRLRAVARALDHLRRQERSGAWAWHAGEQSRQKRRHQGLFKTAAAPPINQQLHTHYRHLSWHPLHMRARQLHASYILLFLLRCLPQLCQKLAFFFFHGDSHAHRTREPAHPHAGALTVRASHGAHDPDGEFLDDLKVKTTPHQPLAHKWGVFRACALHVGVVSARNLAFTSRLGQHRPNQPISGQPRAP